MSTHLDRRVGGIGLCKQRANVNSLNRRSFTLQAIAEVSEILTVQKTKGADCQFFRSSDRQGEVGGTDRMLKIVHLEEAALHLFTVDYDSTLASPARLTGDDDQVSS